jgi:hypothetical protein
MSNYKVITYRFVRVLEDAAVAMRTRGVMDVWCHAFLNSALVYGMTGQINAHSPKMEQILLNEF